MRILGRYVSTASWMASRLSEKSASRGTSIQQAALSSESKEYMPNVGGQDRIHSPGSSRTRMSKLMSSSAPAPASRYSSSTAVNAASDFRKVRLSGSG